MDASIIALLEKLGTGAAIAIICYLRLIRADKQVDAKDAQIKAASDALMALSNEAVKVIAESRAASDTKDARLLALENQVSDLRRGRT